jgi:hypothetical protein
VNAAEEWRSGGEKEMKTALVFLLFSSTPFLLC